MNPLLRDLLDHQFWADVESWNAIATHEPARRDHAIHNRLHHIHQVQRGFVYAVGDRKAHPTLTKPGDYQSFDKLRDYARASHEQIVQCVASLAESRLAEQITIPWFPAPPLSLTVEQALTQMVMHSQHHRGQNATRLRELGAVPPTTDLIVWYWKGRPTLSW